MTRDRFDRSLGVWELKPRRWFDSPAGARATLAAAFLLSVLLVAAIARAATA